MGDEHEHHDHHDHGPEHGHDHAPGGFATGQEETVDTEEKEHVGDFAEGQEDAPHGHEHHDHEHHDHEHDHD